MIPLRNAPRNGVWKSFANDHAEATAGFTIVELLVSIGIISILLALLLPAVQNARNTAKRVECINKCRQIALAVHEFEESHGHFPSGKTSLRADVKTPEMSWLVPLLPYLEQKALSDEAISAFERVRLPYRNPPHNGLARAVQAFACPSDSRCNIAQSASSLEGAYVGLTSYLGVSGLDHTKNEGMLFLDSNLQFRDITDGSSNTLLFGERPPSSDFNFGWWYTGRGQDGSGNVDMFLGVNEKAAAESRFEQHGCSKRFGFVSGKIDDLCDSLHFWSLHEGGASFALCDGSVRFISYHANEILTKIATRSGGEVVSSEF